MPTLTCPHCGKSPATGLHRFLPLTKLVRETFACNLCGGRSEFSTSSERWSIAAGIVVLVTVLLALRLAMTSLETTHIPMNTLGAIGFFIALIFTYQIPAALVLRAKTTLLALEPDGS
jgi:hypothetical protein